jgi:hypothetical protein
MLSACTSSNLQPTARGFTVIADGFNGPTQITDGPDGLLFVAQLNGEENASTGQVVVFDPTTKTSSRCRRRPISVGLTARAIKTVRR